MTKFYFVRHGQTETNLARRFNGGVLTHAADAVWPRWGNGSGMVALWQSFKMIPKSIIIIIICWRLIINESALNRSNMR